MGKAIHGVVEELDRSRVILEEIARWRERRLLDAAALDAIEADCRQRDRWLAENIDKTKFFGVGFAKSRVLITVLSVLGAISLAAGIVILFVDYWELIPRAAKAALLVATFAGLSWAGMHLRYRAGYPRTGYALILVGLIVSGASLWLIARLYDIQSHPAGFWLFCWLVWLSAGYVFRFQLVTAIGLLALFQWLGLGMGYFDGTYWVAFDEPRTFLFYALLVMGIGFAHQYRHMADQVYPYFLVSSLVLLTATLVLSFEHWNTYGAEHLFYIGLLAFESVVLILGAIRYESRTALNLGVVFFLVNAYTRYFEYLWGLMPKSLAFIATGAFLIATAVFFERRRKQLLALLEVRHAD